MDVAFPAAPATALGADDGEEDIRMILRSTRNAGMYALLFLSVYIFSTSSQDHTHFFKI